MDDINREILKLLKANGRLSWQQIGKSVHLTGQAVATRVQQMQDLGILKGFTIRQDFAKPQFISVFMENPDFDAFESFLQMHEDVESAHKVTGEACYHLLFSSVSDEHLELFLKELLRLDAIAC